MFGTFDEGTRRRLQAEGYVPAGFDCLWVGDEFVWEVTNYRGGITHRNVYYTIVDVKTSVHSDQDIDGRLTGETNTVLKLVVKDSDGLLDHMSINIDHMTWARQCQRNKETLFDLKAYYEANLAEALNSNRGVKRTFWRW